MAFKHTFRPSCFWCGGKHQQPRQQNAVSLSTSRASAGVDHDDKLDSSNPILSLKTQTWKLGFVTECDTTPQFARKYSANLHLIHEEKTKVVKAQIDSACSCNTIPSGLLRNLFPGAEIHRTSSKINTYGNETMRPEGQVTLKGQDSHHRFPCGKRSRWECRCTILNL